MDKDTVVKLEENVPSLDGLVVMNPYMENITGNAGGDGMKMASDLSIISADVVF
jgi:hypothetical protein